MRPHVHVVVLLVCLALFRAAPTVAQADVIDLQVKVGKGEAVFHSIRTTMQMGLDLPGTRTNANGRTEGRRAVRVLDVGDDGAMLTELVLEDFRITMDGRTEEPIDAPWTVKVAPNGRVLERIVGAERLEDFPLPLPGRPVRVGESWTRESTITESGFTGRATETFTLTAVEGADDARVARIRGTLAGTVTGGQLGQLPPGTQVRLSGTMRGVENVAWSVPRGRIVTSSQDLTIDVQADVSAQGQTARIRLMLRTSTQVEPLASGTPPVPQVSPDLLVSSGKGIGAFGLAMTAAEFANALAEPEELGTDGVTGAPRVRWRNGLIGYLDPADRAKIAGLTVAERAYQTEKGLKFGSSEGAVLMAYGLSPIKVNATVPNIGGVRMLIYNDQGIAFAITSDAAHAGRGSSHAPIGAVDWITVFPPGGAAKIYTLP